MSSFFASHRSKTKVQNAAGDLINPATEETLASVDSKVSTEAKQDAIISVLGVPRQEDGHGSTSGSPTFVNTASSTPVFYQGTITATGNVSGLDAIDVSGYLTLDFQFQGTVSPQTIDATWAIEGTNDPTAAPGDGATVKGWHNLTPSGETGQRLSSAIKNPGRYFIFNPPRFVRVRCITFVSGSSQCDLMVKPVAEPSRTRWISDQDNLARLAMTTFGQMQVAQRTYLAGDNFDTASLDTAKWENLNANGGSHVFSGGVLELHTGTATNGLSGVRSLNTAEFLGATDNAMTARVQLDGTGGTDHGYRFGVYDDNNGFFVEVVNGAYKYFFRKGGVDAESPFGVLGVSTVTPNTSLNLWEITYNPNFVIFRNSGNFVQLLLGDATLSSMLEDYDLPVTAEVFNDGSTTDHVFKIQTLSVERLGNPHTIRANERFSPNDTLSATAAVIQGQQPDEDFEQVRVPGSVPEFSTQTPLGIGGVYAPTITPTSIQPGPGFDTTGFTSVLVNVISDVASATDGLKIQFSNDNFATVCHETSHTYSASDINKGRRYIIPSNLGEQFRVRYTNGGTGQTTFDLRTELAITATQPMTDGIGRGTILVSPALRLSQTLKRVPVTVTGVAVAADTNLRTNTAGKRFFCVGYNWLITNSSTANPARILIRDGIGGALRIPIGCQEGALGADFADSGSGSFPDEGLPFNTGVYLDVVTGTVSVDVVLHGYEEDV